MLRVLYAGPSAKVFTSIYGNYDPGPAKRNILSGWVDSDFASDIDTRKSVTGYLLWLNGGPISWKAARQGGVTLCRSEAEFVAASQAGKEVLVLYLRALLKAQRSFLSSASADRALGGQRLVYPQE